MTNNPISISEARSFTAQLIEKTRVGKLTWEPVESDHGEGDETPESFAVAIGEAFRFGVYKYQNSTGGRICGFRMQDGIGAELLHVQVELEPPYGFGSIDEASLAKELPNLYEYARRSALKVDTKVSEARELLLSL